MVASDGVLNHFSMCSNFEYNRTYLIKQSTESDSQRVQGSSSAHLILRKYIQIETRLKLRWRNVSLHLLCTFAFIFSDRHFS